MSRPRRLLLLAGSLLAVAAGPLAAAPAASGKTPPKVTERIIGGANATRGQFPFVTALLYATEPDNYQAQFCAGTLIHPRWVVTAAHCVHDLIPPEIQVVPGAHDLSETLARIPVVDIIVHPLYRPDSDDHDIALLLLGTPSGQPTAGLVHDDAVQAPPGTLATIAGWGDTTDGNGVFPTILQTAQVPIVPLAVANATQAYNGSLTERMIAAGYQNGLIDTCGGDSGGPLLVPAPGGGWLLAGVTSFGAGCGKPDAYGIYARVAALRAWVRGNVYPGFGPWEAAAGTVAANDDPDGDGVGALVAYALTGEPGKAVGALGPVAGRASVAGQDHATLTVPRWSGASDVSWVLEESADLKAWGAVDAASRQVGSPVAIDARRERVTYRAALPLASEAARHLRLRPVLTDGFVPSADVLQGFGFRRYTLHALLPFDPARGSGSFRYRDALVTGLPGGSTVRVSARSRDLAAYFRVEDATTGAAVTVTPITTGAGDQLGSFVATAGATYRVRASTTTSNASGPVRLAVYAPSTAPALAVGAAAQSGSINMNTDPFVEAGASRYYHDTFQLTGTAAGGVVAITMRSSSSQFDPYVEVLDAETGETLWDDDDNGVGIDGLDARAIVPVFNNAPLLVRATTALGSMTGNYTVQATTTTLTALAINNTFVNGTLSTSSRWDGARWGTGAHYSQDYLLAAGTTGTTVAVELRSTTMDTFLLVLDAATGAIVAENDDGFDTGTNSRATFVLRPNTRYVIRASTYDQELTGAFTIKAQAL